MDSEKITAFVQEHWNIILIAAGAVLIMGAALNWNWLCDPTGAPQSHRYGTGGALMRYRLSESFGGKWRFLIQFFRKRWRNQDK